jgi:hypothetical protein
MRRSLAVLALLLTTGLVMSADATELKFCPDLKDEPARDTCFQDHITHLEDDILRLAGEVTALNKALEQKLSGSDVYKLRAMTQGKCLGFSGNDQSLSMQNCDHPDSWKLMVGGQPLAKADNKKAAPTSSAPVGQITPSATAPANNNAGSPPQAAQNAQSSTAPAKSPSSKQ